MEVVSRANGPQISLVPITSVNPYDKNPRTHSKRQKELVKEAVRYHGQVFPIVVDDSNTVIDGHIVLEAMVSLGYDEINVVKMSGRNTADIQALRLALNQTHSGSHWDSTKLAGELQQLKDLCFDLKLTGFSPVKIDRYLNIGKHQSNSTWVHQPAVSQIGDMWILDKHLIGCGAGLDQNLVTTMLEGKNATLAIMNPFSRSCSDEMSGDRIAPKSKPAVASAEAAEHKRVDDLMKALALVSENVTPGGVIFAFTDWPHIYEVLRAAKLAMLELSDLCVWAKPHSEPGMIYNNQHEIVAVLRAAQASISNSRGVGRKRRRRSNVWSYRGVYSVGNDANAHSKLHSAAKPIALVADALRDVSIRGDIVLDTFLGSGLTLMAAEETGRRCYGLEIDPPYVDAIVRRWQIATKRQAILKSSGDTFHNVEIQRSSESRGAANA